MYLDKKVHSDIKLLLLGLYPIRNMVVFSVSVKFQCCFVGLGSYNSWAKESNILRSWKTCFGLK